MYVKAFDDGTVPDTETLSLTHLPDGVRWPTVTVDPAKLNQLPDTETLSLTHLPDGVRWPTVTVDPAKLNQLPAARPANTKLKSKAKY